MRNIGSSVMEMPCSFTEESVLVAGSLGSEGRFSRSSYSSEDSAIIRYIHY